MTEKQSKPTTRTLFNQQVRIATKALEPLGWKGRGAGAVRHHQNGYWATISFMGAGRNRNENVSMVRTGLIAGVCPPVLLSKANNQDPLKPPGRFKHATVCEDIPIHFVESGTGPFTQARVATETPGIEGRQRGGSPIVLDLSMIQNWLQPALAWLADECDQLCSDRALYQRLVQDGGTGELRNAAILAHHMGDDDVLAETLKAAKAAYELDIVRRREHWSDFQPGRRDRQTRYPQDWSHQRFLQSLEISDT